MKLYSPHRLRPLLLCAIPIAAALSAGAALRVKQASPKALPKASLPLRALIVGGGSSPKNTQYAIESNARYLDILTTTARSKTILFADGSKSTRSVNAVEISDEDKVANAMAFLFDEPWPEERLKFHPPFLRRIDGATSETEIAGTLKRIGQTLKSNESALLYFTGHGFPNEIDGRDDFENTRYALWDDNDLSVRELAAMLRPLPANRPVVLVMVQCHSGGFANLMFENGDPKQPLISREFCGFFAATKERMSAGCTPEVDERNYHDFTTHFFAALSGRTRDNRTVLGADYNRDQRVSMLEAYAWANLNDRSIDVPVCTSDAYLRHIFRDDGAWRQQPYSKVLSSGAPWQKAMLEGLSRELKLTGEERLQTVWSQTSRTWWQGLKDKVETETPWPTVVLDRRATLIENLEDRFPGLRSKPNSPSWRVARQNTITWLRSRPDELRWMQTAVKNYENVEEVGEVRVAMRLRFLRVARTLWCESQLKRRGTTSQKRFFQKLRSAESRNPLRD